MEFQSHILQQQLSICHLEALNAVAAIKVWATIFIKQLLQLVSDNTRAVSYLPGWQGHGYIYPSLCQGDLAHLRSLGCHLRGIARLRCLPPEHC